MKDHRKPNNAIQAPDLSTFVQSYTSNWLWYSGANEAEIGTLPYGARYWVLYAPVFNAKSWHYTYFEIRKLPEIEAIRKATGRAFYRAHVTLQTIHLEAAPFEWSPFDKTQKELDEMQQLHSSKLIYHPEWPAYLDGKTVSVEFMERVKQELSAA